MIETWYYRIFVIISLILISSFIISCNQNKFELETVIYPKIRLSSGDVTVEYKLGDLLILDVWDSLNAAQAIYLLDGEKKKEVHLKVIAGDFDGAQFYYTVAGSIEVKTSPVKFKTMERNVNSFPNVVWLVKKGGTIPEKERTVEKPDDLKSVVDGDKDGIGELKL